MLIPIGMYIVVLLSIQNTLAVFKVNKVSCTVHDKTFMKLTACQLKAVKRNVAEFTFRGIILKPPIRQCTLHIELFRKYTIYRPFFVNFTFDACEFMRDRPKYPIASFIYNAYAKYSNINHTCPYEGEVIVDKFAPNKDIAFLPLPTAEYLLKTDWISDGNKFISVNIWFILDEFEKSKLK